MEFIPTKIEDVVLIKSAVYEDSRGFFMESYRKSNFADHGIEIDFVQDNLSLSAKGAVRGLHYQIQNQQAKLVMAPKGEILDVAVDLREGSPTFGKYISVILSETNKNSLYIPTGFAHGYSVLSDQTLVFYKCSDYYNADVERGLRWNDPELQIDWKVSGPTLSEKDKRQPFFKDIPKKDLFNYNP